MIEKEQWIFLYSYSATDGGRWIVEYKMNGGTGEVRTRKEELI